MASGSITGRNLDSAKTLELKALLDVEEVWTLDDWEGAINILNRFCRVITFSNSGQYDFLMIFGDKLASQINLSQLKACVILLVESFISKNG